MAAALGVWAIAALGFAFWFLAEEPDGDAGQALIFGVLAPPVFVAVLVSAVVKELCERFGAR